MRRLLFVMSLVGVALVIGLALWARQAAATPLATPTAADCRLIVGAGTPDFQAVFAAESLYENMPLFQTPVVLLVTPDKPFAAGCLAGE